MTVHPEDPTRSPQPWVVIGWTAPHEGDIEVVGYLDNWGPHGDPTPSPPDGTDWRLRRTAAGVTTLEASGYLPEFGVLTLEGMTFHVEPGDTLWLMVGPRSNKHYDQLKIELSIIPTTG